MKYLDIHWEFILYHTILQAIYSTSRINFSRRYISQKPSLEQIQAVRTLQRNLHKLGIGVEKNINSLTIIIKI